MDAESWFNAKKAVERACNKIFCFRRRQKIMGYEKALEAVMFSRKAVTNSLLQKLMPEKKNGTPIEQLEKRLSLLAH
jgi:ATP-dependent Clp protease protease subunit